MILDLFQITGDRFGGLGAFEVMQYFELAELMEAYMAAGFDFDDAYAAAKENNEIM